MEPPHSVRSRFDGFDVAILARSRVEAEQGVALVDDALDLYQGLAQEREATATSPSAVGVARERVAAARSAVAFLEKRADRLVVRAPHAGTFVGRDPHELIGQMASIGQVLGEVVDTQNVRIAAAMTQLEAAWLFDEGEKPRVAMRPVSRPGLVVKGDEIRAIDAGQLYLPHASLGFAGGGTIRTKQDDRTGLQAETAQLERQTAERDARTKEHARQRALARQLNLMRPDAMTNALARALLMRVRGNGE